MINPNKIDFNQIPKRFCDGAVGTYRKDLFSFAFTSGNNIDAYATTPIIMKSITMWMNEQVKNYEKKFGEINMTPPEIESPIQINDLNK